jgi:hypothetical protein
MASEKERLSDAAPWRRWGPYLSERQWGTVREDMSADGNAWESLTHDQARSRAYRWGEDGLAGISDENQLLCFGLALWNERDPILKERAFGLTNVEGNHGEDLKEYYFYLDSTPTHSWMRWLYKYPQAEFPYADLVTENRRRGPHEMEYELIDTGVFAEGRYFDVEVDYAKASPEDLLVEIRATNRGPDAAPLHLLPTLWFRNTWSRDDDAERPRLTRGSSAAIRVEHPTLGVFFLHVEGDAEVLFTENETNRERFGEGENSSPFVKDAFHASVVGGDIAATNPDGLGTKAAAHVTAVVGPGETWTVRLRLAHAELADPFGEFEAIAAARRAEADEFYGALLPETSSEDERRVLRQALAGMLWSKQFYAYDVAIWLRDRGRTPFDAGTTRNAAWYQMENSDVISMPDTWEYPWYAAWDLAFHCIALAVVDIEFAKRQLELMVSDTYLHPSGQIPAYEWDFSDVNPPVHAWAAIYIFRMEAATTGKEDTGFLLRIFQKLLLYFAWWVNRKDPRGQNVFQGGFLGLDNIGVFDRSHALPTGGQLEQADGTAWMALFSQCMLTIALVLEDERPEYEDLAFKFAEHFLWIRAAMQREGPEGMWDDEDGFYYDVMRLPDGTATRLKVRSMVGLLPLAAATVFTGETVERHPNLVARIEGLLERHPEIRATSRPGPRGEDRDRILSILDEDQLRRVLRYVLDEDEFLSPYGLRSVSRYHLEHPYRFWVDGNEYRVDYEPAESTTRMFGGNSNWRGPIWFPVNILILRALLQLDEFYEDEFTIEHPTGSGNEMRLRDVARELAHRLTHIFLDDENGRRAVFGGSSTFQDDPNWHDNLLFYEYFHGDNGAGLGAAHQTGWTGLVAVILFHLAEADMARSLLQRMADRA